jgi:hypothetical protein
VLAVGAAGIFAVANLARTSSGGASTADELGLELLAAIENEDVLGVIDLLVPGERDAFRGPIIDVASELTRLEVLPGDFDLSQLAGLDIEFERESADVRSTNVDDIVNVDLRADAMVTLDGGDLPIGDLLTDYVPDDALTELRGSRVTTTEDLDISLTAVSDGERWYFSLFHTIAELARRDLAPGTPIPANGIGADGTATPEAAVDQLLERVEDLDLTGLLRTLNPGEAGALQRYAPLFLEDAEAELAAAPIDWAITDRAVRIEGSGDDRTAFLDAISIEGTIDGEAFALAVEGDCASAELGGDTFETCGTGLADFDEVFADAPAVRHLLDTITDAFADIEPIGLELRRVDGEWYVSVTETVSEALLAVLRALDRNELDAIIDAGGDAFTEIFDMTFDDLAGGLMADDFGDDSFFGELDGFEDAFDEGVLDERIFEDAEWFRCYDEFSADAAIACFATYVDSGEIDASEIPVELRFPECGYADVAWSGELYQMSDDDFIAKATPARACFLDLVEQGRVAAWELPTEITQIECFEGRNWYNVFDDPEYDERYYECVGAGFDG